MKASKICCSVALVFSVLAFSGTSFARVNDDEVTSRKIDEADGTSGQSTNSGSGVKTGHIQDGAVTDAKSNDVSMAKVNGLSSALAGKADANHTHSYANVIVVAKSGGDFTDPVAAMASITDASESNPYLVKVMPGIYNIGDNSLQMKSFVTLEGSSRETTTITSSVNNVDFDTCTEATIVMADNSAIRELRVGNVAADEGNENLAAAVTFNNVKGLAEEVNIRIGDNTVHSARNNGVCANGANSMADLNDVDIEVYTMGGHANAVIISDSGKMKIKDSRLFAQPAAGNDSSTHVVDCYNFQTSNQDGRVDITDSYIESSDDNAPEGWYSTLWLDNCVANISNTIVKLNNASGLVIDAAGNPPYTILNSQLYGPVEVVALSGDGRIANSLLQGEVGQNAGIKLLNNYNENLSPIANQ